MKILDMRKSFLSWFLQACAVMLLCTAGAGAQEAAVSRADAGAIEQVIRAQLAAFAADDAAKAFSFAAPGIRRTFGTAQNFMDMVRKGYPVVYRPASVAFLRPEVAGNEILQPVQMSDSAGQLWVALYNMQRQPGNKWLTGGCRLLRTEGKVTQAYAATVTSI